MDTATQVDYVKNLRSRLEITGSAPERTPEQLALFAELRHALEFGMVRVAEPAGDAWVVNVWVKQALLAVVQAGALTVQQAPFPGADLDTMPWRSTPFLGCRVPAGSFVRHAARLEPGVTLMPGAVVQMGAYIGAGSMIDSHAMIGACAQVGRGVNIGCQAAVGGILLPLEASPNIIEDEVVLGYNCGVFDGVRIGARSILAANTTISGLAGVYDAIDRVWLRAEGSTPLTIPPGSVVTMGIHDVDTEVPVVRTLVPVIVDRRG